MGQVLKTGRPLHDLLSRVFAAQKLSAHTSFGENAGCASGRKPAFLQAQVEILESKISENVHIVYEEPTNLVTLGVFAWSV